MHRPRRPSTWVLAALLTSCGTGTDPASNEASLEAARAGVPAFALRKRWPDHDQGTLRLTYRIDTNRSPLPAEDFVAGVEQAVALWNATGLVELQQAPAETNPSVSLSWHRGHHGACEPFGSSAAVAHTGPPKPGTFIHFDAARKWSRTGDSEGANSVMHTTLHELGHVFGLGHSSSKDAVMNLEVERASYPAAADLAGLQTLYGGGTDRSGDLVVGEPSSRMATLRLVAPEGRSDYACFDTDGNGRDEVLVWRTDRAGLGAVTAYHFDKQGRPERTTGPFLAVTTSGLLPRFVRLPDGRRILVGEIGPRRALMEFDEHGTLLALQGPPPATELLDRASRDKSGDLNGDGESEAVTRATGLPQDQ